MQRCETLLVLLKLLFKLWGRVVTGNKKKREGKSANKGKR